jgi:ribonuclease E
MSSPASGNDDWDDLARELGVSKSDPQPAPPPDMVERITDAEAVEPHHDDARTEDDELAAGEPELAADETPDAEAADNPNATGEPIPAGEPGKRKRRRRRRRRKGAPVEGTEPVASGPDDDAAEPDEEELSESAESAEANDEDAFADAAGEVAEDASDEDEDVLQPVGAEEEDVATEALRDLIANWNVPAWDEIIGGLYRPS